MQRVILSWWQLSNKAQLLPLWDIETLNQGRSSPFPLVSLFNFLFSLSSFFPPYSLFSCKLWSELLSLSLDLLLSQNRNFTLSCFLRNFGFTFFSRMLDSEKGGAGLIPLLNNCSSIPLRTTVKVIAAGLVLIEDSTTRMVGALTIPRSWCWLLARPTRLFLKRKRMVSAGIRSLLKRIECRSGSPGNATKGFLLNNLCCLDSFHTNTIYISGCSLC